MKTIAILLVLLAPVIAFSQQAKTTGSPKPKTGLDTLLIKVPNEPSAIIFKVVDTTGTIREYGKLVNGNREGVWRTYFDNHVLYTVDEYHNGVKNGYSEMVASDGMVMKEEYYKDGVLNGPSRIYNRNNSGKLKLEENYKDGKAVGIRRTYYPEGALQEVGYFNLAGNRDSINRWYYSNGKLLVEYLYVNGNINGPSKSYYENGKLKAEGMMVDNLESGHWKEYSDSGKIKQEGDYIAGKKTGIWKIYNENGVVEKTQTFKDGQMIEEKTVKKK